MFSKNKLHKLKKFYWNNDKNDKKKTVINKTNDKYFLNEKNKFIFYQYLSKII